MKQKCCEKQDKRVTAHLVDRREVFDKKKKRSNKSENIENVVE